MDSYAVLGSPVAHSRSPFLFTEFAKQTGEILQYEKIETSPPQLPSTLAAFISRGGKGVNITAPLKEVAFQLAHETSSRAQAAQAINVLCFRNDGSYYGDNVDGIGLIRDLTLNQQFSLANKHILLIGAGGAAKGVIHNLLECKPASIMIVNRTKEKALTLAKKFDILTSDWDALANHQFDLILNATSATLQHATLPLPDHITHANSLCYDMVYGIANSPFEQWAIRQSTKHCQGLGMLIEQAAETFYLWRGIRPKTML